jgi:signal transduction histidine kinase
MSERGISANQQTSWRHLAAILASHDGQAARPPPVASIEFGTVLFLIALLLVVTIGIASLIAFDPNMEPYAQRTKSLLASHWLLVVTSFVLFVEVGLTAAILWENRARRTAEALLRQSEDQMAVAAEFAGVGLWRWDRIEGTIWISGYGRRLLRLADDFVLTPTTFNELIHPDDRTVVSQAIADAVREGYSHIRTHEIVYRFLRPGDNMCWLRMRGQARRIGTNDRDFELAGTVTDITDIKKMQAEIERQKLSLLHLSRISVLGELSGALAHELKQPLTAIMSNAQAAQRLLDHEPLDLKELREAISDIVSDDARAGAVITHLRALLKPDTVQREVLDLNAVVASALELSQSDLTTRGIAVVVQPSSSRLYVSADSIQLQQLLLNLIVNAAEAMASDTSGTLVISTDRIDSQTVHLAVMDTGTGIAPDMMARLFDPLVSSKPHGLGLGLSICRAIVDAHGGSIKATNNPGRGATFHVLLPSTREVPPS